MGNEAHDVCACFLFGFWAFFTEKISSALRSIVANDPDASP
jgi:hypothetical protein